jgi:hypothetical protein
MEIDARDTAGDRVREKGFVRWKGSSREESGSGSGVISGVDWRHSSAGCGNEVGAADGVGEKGQLQLTGRKNGVAGLGTRAGKRTRTRNGRNECVARRRDGNRAERGVNFRGQGVAEKGAVGKVLAFATVWKRAWASNQSPRGRTSGEGPRCEFTTKPTTLAM